MVLLQGQFVSNCSQTDRSFILLSLCISVYLSLCFSSTFSLAFSFFVYNMSQPSVSQSTEGSPVKRARLDKKQFIGPCYIRMQPLSFAIALKKIRFDFINPTDGTSVSRGARAVMDELHKKLADTSLLMQSRKNTSWGKMGGAAPSLFPTPCCVTGSV
jgi:hypothetical protein